MNFKNKLKIVCNKWKSDLFFKQNEPLVVLNDFDTLEYILKNKCSISRFGDGEMDLMLNIPIVFQDANNLLKKKLLEVAADTSTNVLKCVPNIFMGDDILKELFFEPDYLWWKRYVKYTKGYWHKFFKSKVLGDSTISRFYVEVKDKSDRDEYVEKLKMLWDKRDIVFIEGEKSRLGFRNDFFNNASSIKRILCPSKNAFLAYDEILVAAKQNCNKSDLIILALGPTATVLSFDLAKIGFQALDLGHADIEYEWYKMKAQSKVPVFNKDANEAGAYTSGEMKDTEYEKQILVRVGLDESFTSD